MQTIESDKIKTVKSSFPSKIASFFGYGTVDVLTEGDTEVILGTMSMYFVSDPDRIVTNIQSLLDTPIVERKKKKIPETESSKPPIQHQQKSIHHTKNIKSKISGVLK